jgi:hypothetical protein
VTNGLVVTAFGVACLVGGVLAIVKAPALAILRVRITASYGRRGLGLPYWTWIFRFAGFVSVWAGVVFIRVPLSH